MQSSFSVRAHGKYIGGESKFADAAGVRSDLSSEIFAAGAPGKGFERRPSAVPSRAVGRKCWWSVPECIVNSFDDQLICFKSVSMRRGYAQVRADQPSKSACVVKVLAYLMDASEEL